MVTPEIVRRIPDEAKKETKLPKPNCDIDEIARRTKGLGEVPPGVVFGKKYTG